MSQLLQYLNDDKSEPIFNENIREDGTLDDTVVETYFCPIDRIYYSESGFIRIQADFNDINIEVRLTVEQLNNILGKINRLGKDSQ